MIRFLKSIFSVWPPFIDHNADWFGLFFRWHITFHSVPLQRAENAMREKYTIDFPSYMRGTVNDASWLLGLVFATIGKPTQNWVCLWLNSLPQTRRDKASTATTMAMMMISSIRKLPALMCCVGYLFISYWVFVFPLFFLLLLFSFCELIN